MTTDCLDPERAAAYARRELPEEARAFVDRHIDQCESCRQLVSALVVSASEGGVPGEPASVLPAGTRLGPYAVLRPLDAGGMGVVYEAFDARLGRRVALKCVRPSAGARGQLLEEARLMASLAHPNVVPVYDVVEHGQLFIAMELVVGQTLGEWLSSGPRGWREVVDAFIEVGEGLAAAHDAGIVHGDVKPSNVLMGADGRVRVADFGLGRRSDEAAPETLRGTPGYLAPEQVSRASHDGRVDQYALCVSLHQGLFGSFPGEPPRRRSRVPARLARLLARGLAAEPADRFTSMHALVGELRALRRARTRALVAAAVAMVLGAAVAWGAGARQERVGRCRELTWALASPWTSEARGQLEHSFLSAKASWGADALSRVEERLDRWDAQLTAAREALCGKGLLSARPAPEAFARRSECLTEAVHRARGVISVLREPSASTQLNGVALAGALTLDCPVAEAPPPSPSPSRLTDAQRSALRDDFARTYALGEAGRFRDMLTFARALLARPELGQDERFRAAALVQLAIALDRTGAADEALGHLQEAIILADAQGDDRLRAQAWVTLAQLDHRRGRYERNLEHEPAMLGAVERVGDAWLRSEAWLMLGGAYTARGDFERAQGWFERALALRRETWGERDQRTAFALSALANALAMQGDLARAATLHAEAVATTEAALGPRHPALATALGNLGNDALYGLEAGPAVEVLARSRELHAANAPGSREAAAASNDLGFALLVAGRPEEALVRFEEADATWATLAPSHPLRAMSTLGRHQALQALGRAGLSAPALEAAAIQSKGVPPFDTARIQLAAAEALGARDAVKAAALMQVALEGLSATTLPLVAQDARRAKAWLEAHRGVR